jgi:hypothetical protein
MEDDAAADGDGPTREMVLVNTPVAVTPWGEAV